MHSLILKITYEILLEARRSDKLGIKSDDTIETLKRYCDSGFATFSTLNKLGINPKSEFDTPLGIYAYPIDEQFIDKLTKHNVEFASERKYIHVMEPRDTSRIL